MMGAVVPEVVIPEHLGVQDGTWGTLLHLNGDFRSSRGNMYSLGAFGRGLGGLSDHFKAWGTTGVLGTELNYKVL